MVAVAIMEARGATVAARRPARAAATGRGAAGDAAEADVDVAARPRVVANEARIGLVTMRLSMS
jgi:hypothetical protein